MICCFKSIFDWQIENWISSWNCLIVKFSFCFSLLKFAKYIFWFDDDNNWRIETSAFKKCKSISSDEDNRQFDSQRVQNINSFNKCASTVVKTEHGPPSCWINAEPSSDENSNDCDQRSNIDIDTSICSITPILVYLSRFCNRR